MSDTLPPLPEPAFLSAGYSQAWSVETIATWPVLNSARYKVPLFTADQMRSYAAAALAAAVAEPVGWLYEGIAPHTQGKSVFKKTREMRLETRWWQETGPLYTAPPQREREFLPLLLRDLCRELGASVPEAAAVLRDAGLGDFSQGAAVTPEMARCLRGISVTPAPPQRDPQWQPIETAPMDGTAVLVMRDIWPGTASGRAEECNGHNTYVAAWWASEGDDGKGRWVCYMDAVYDPICPVAPTHWMPLPDAPASAPKEAP